MERLACVNIPLLALQILLRDHPNWKGKPVVVVDKDSPQGIVLQRNAAASGFSISPGMRFSTARSLCVKLNAGIVTQTMLKKTVDNFHADLFEFCPEIDLGSFSHLLPFDSKNEDYIRFAGVAWLRVTGLDALFGSFENWATKLYEHLNLSGLTPSIAVTFSRFGAYVLAKSNSTGIFIPKTPEEARACIYETPLARIELNAKPLHKLHRLGIRTLSSFLQLPAGSIQKRFGLEAFAVWKECSALNAHVLKPIHYEEALEEKVSFDEPESDTTRLLFSVKNRLHVLCLKLAIRSYDLKEIRIHFHLENGEDHKEKFRPATPSLDEVRWIALIRLRLDRIRLSSEVNSFTIFAEGIPYQREQLNLLHDMAKRDPYTTQHGIEELRAAFGQSIVKKAILEKGYLPKEQFRLEEISTLPRPRVLLPKFENEARTKKKHFFRVRRLFHNPHPIARFDPHPASYVTVHSIEEGGIKSYEGPFSTSGAWWTQWHYRDEYYAQTQRGDRYWLYFDHRSHQWNSQGHFE